MLDIALYNSRQHRQFQHRTGRLMLARPRADQSLWITVDPVHTDHSAALLEIVPVGDCIELRVAGCENLAIDEASSALLDTSKLPTPVRFSIGDTRFEIAETSQRAKAPHRPLEKLLGDKRAPQKPITHRGGPSPATLSRWFAALGAINRWANSLQELYVQAARCAVDSMGLDGAIVLRRRDNRWEIAASHLPHPELGIHCDLEILDHLLATPETLFHGTAKGQESRVKSQEPETTSFIPALDPRPSTVDQPAVVVSPLRNAAAALVGAIYGYRSVRAGNARRGIRYLEAHLVELVANTVSEGIARLEQEAEVDRRRVLLEQAIASQTGGAKKIIVEERDVTLLFADLRGSTELAQSLDSEPLYELLGQVMECLTAAVMDHDGMVIDYYGDGLAAMWNAPADQAEHPELACRAALRMLETLPDITADWASMLTGQLRLGIGLHTGFCQLGNAGSSRRQKYGPRGTNVHLASRIETATKELALPLLLSEATAARLSNQFHIFRVCRAQLLGMDEATDMYSLCMRTGDTTRQAALDTYSQALTLFEKGALEEAARMLAKIDLLATYVPARFLADQIQQLIHRQNRRRSTDGDKKTTNSVIQLDAK